MATNPESVPRASPAEVRAWVKEGRPLVLVDVRDAKAWAQGHIEDLPSVHHVPKAEIVGWRQPRPERIPLAHDVICY